GQVYNLTEDKSRYMQRYYDSRESTEALGKYHERVDLEDLLDRPEKLLHFGSVFGSSRLVIRLQSSKVFWNNLQREMVPNNPIILEMVDMIINKIGKENNYVGVHARLGDHFSKHSEKTVQKLIDNLKRDFSGHRSGTNQDNEINLDFNKTCYPKFDSKSSIIIYLATDAHRKAECLRPFIEMFP
ncbi:1223_t:CDS:1, partial [Acaulospora morrowiae]